MKGLDLQLSKSPFGQLQPNQQLLIVTAVIVLGTLIIAHRWIIQPTDRQRAILQEQHGVARQRVALIQTIDATHRTLDQLRQQLRSRKAVSTLLQEITTLAETHQVSVNILGPQPTTTVGRYTKLPIRIEGTGGFSDILQLLYAMETVQSSYRIEHCEISVLNEPGGAPAPVESPKKLRLRLTVNTLLLESP